MVCNVWFESKHEFRLESQSITLYCRRVLWLIFLVQILWAVEFKKVSTPVRNVLRLPFTKHPLLKLDDHE